MRGFRSRPTPLGSVDQGISGISEIRKIEENSEIEKLTKLLLHKSANHEKIEESKTTI